MLADVKEWLREEPRQALALGISAVALLLSFLEVVPGPVDPAWLAVLLAGQTPVMLNWTTGPRNLGHCLRLAGVRHILSARALLDRLEGSGLREAAEEAGALVARLMQDVCPAGKELSVPLLVDWGTGHDWGAAH